MKQSCAMEGVCVTIENPAFCLFLCLTGLHFRGELQHVGEDSQQNIKWRPIRTGEIGGTTLSDVLYVCCQKQNNCTWEEDFFKKPKWEQLNTFQTDAFGVISWNAFSQYA